TTPTRARSTRRSSRPGWSSATALGSFTCLPRGDDGAPQALIADDAEDALVVRVGLVAGELRESDIQVIGCETEGSSRKPGKLHRSAPPLRRRPSHPLW